MNTMKIRALIVDDEPLARERIRTLLEKESDFVVAGECASGTEAVAAMRKERPDLVFLDVQMPQMNGFDVLRELGKDDLPEVIFVTAFDQHALAAFEVHALDYLLKPFKQARFREALDRVRQHLENKQAGAASKRLLEMLGHRSAEPAGLTRLAVKSNDRIVFLKPAQIDYIESAGNYAVLHVGTESHILRETMTSLEGKLAADQFLRISRSALVNVERIKELQPLFKGDYVVVLQDGTRLPMSRPLREIQAHLKIS